MCKCATAEVATEVFGTLLEIREEGFSRESLEGWE